MDSLWQEVAAGCLVIASAAYLGWRLLSPRLRGRRRPTCAACGMCDKSRR